MTALEERDDRLVGMLRERRDRFSGGDRRLTAVSQPVDHGDERAARRLDDEVRIPALALSAHRARGDAPLEE